MRVIESTRTFHTIVIGAAGRTGLAFVRLAVSCGDRVTAVVRNPERFTETHPNVRVVAGDVLVPQSLGPAFADGADAVVSALGAPTSARGEVRVFSDGTRNVFSAMEACGIRRFVALSAAGMHSDAYDPFYLRFLAKPILRRVLKGPYDDMSRMETLVKASSVDWTLVVPTRLTDGPASAYRVAVDHNVPTALQVSRANVAACMRAALLDDQTIGHALFVAD